MPVEPSKSPSCNFSRSLLIDPDVNFQSQSDDEMVRLVVRQHPLTQFQWIFNVLILILLMILLNLVLPGTFGISARQMFVITTFGVVFIFSYTWLNYLLWYFTVGIVTNVRILDLDFYNVIYKEFSATVLSHVSETTTRIGGFFGSLFDFGNVIVKTEGFEPNIEFHNIPQPSFVVKIINDLMAQFRTHS